MTAVSDDLRNEDTKQFIGRVVDAIDGASVALLLSIGHRTGLLDTMAGLAPATSTEIAEAAGLDERYVREWLAGMVTGRIVVYDPAASTYVLPPHRAAVLVRAAGTRNLASIALSIPMFGEVEEQIVDCFRNGGGVPYSAYRRFHATQAEQNNAMFDTVLIDEIPPLVDGLPERLQAGIDVADIGCGSGHAVNLLAKEFPASRFTGIDFADEALTTGVAEAQAWGLSNASFEGRDLAELNVGEAYDVITAFDAIHDQAAPARVLDNVYAALRPGGVFLMADVKAFSKLEDNMEVPLSTYLYTTSTMHCMSVSLAHDGAGLGTAWGKELALSMLADAGFTEVAVKEVKPDPGNYYYIAHKKPAEATS